MNNLKKHWLGVAGALGLTLMGYATCAERVEEREDDTELDVRSSGEAEKMPRPSVRIVYP